MKNPPGFIFPHTGTPKTHPILDANLRRRTFRGVCNTPLHVYVQNLTGFTFPHLNTSKTHPILDPNLWRGTFGGVCFCALHGYMKNLAGFIPKSSAQDISGRMLLRPTRVRANLAQFYTQTFVAGHFGAYAIRPYTGTPKKIVWFHISAHRCTKNVPDFTIPNRDTPKTHPISPFPIRIYPKPARF